MKKEAASTEALRGVTMGSKKTEAKRARKHKRAKLKALICKHPLHKIVEKTIAENRETVLDSIAKNNKLFASIVERGRWEYI